MTPSPTRWIPRLLPLLLPLLAAPALAHPQLVPAQSEISFVSKQMGVPVEGRFKQFSASVDFDPRKPDAARIGFTIQTGSAAFGAAETDAEVPKPAWLHVAKFPTASFQSSAVKALGGGKFEVRGTLSIKGASQAVAVPVSLTQAGPVSTATGSFVIQRLAFKIGEGEWADTSMVANDVTVKFKLVLSGMAPL